MGVEPFCDFCYLWLTPFPKSISSFPCSFLSAVLKYIRCASVMFFQKVPSQSFWILASPVF